MAHDVFISHSSSDKTVADAVCAKLETAAIRCWIAPRDVQPGRSFAGEITRAIQQSKIMVLIFSARSNNSDQVLREVQLAVNSHLHIIQFRIEDVHLNDDLRYFLSTPHWLDALTPPLEAHLERLKASINTLLAEPAEAAQSGPPAVTSPAVTGSGDRGSSIPRLERQVAWWQQPKVVGLGAAALVLLVLGVWWLSHSKRTPAITHIAPPTVNVPLTTPSVQPVVPREQDQAMRAYQEWASQPKTTPSVNPQTEVPVQRRFVLQQQERVTDENFSPDGKYVATASTDGSVRIWQLENGKAIGEPLQAQGEVKHVLFSPDGSRILTIAAYPQLWDFRTRRLLGEKRLGSGVRAASFSPDGKRVVTMDSSGVVQVWDAATWVQVGKTMRHETDFYSDVQFSPDGTRILSTGESGARLWDAASGDQIGDTLRGAAKAAFSPDGSRIASAPKSSGKAAIWDAHTGAKLLELDTMYAIYSLGFSPDGRYIATASQDYTARIWDGATGQQHGQPLRHDAAVWLAIFSSDSKRLATASMDETARLWDAENTQPLSKPLGQDQSRNRMRVHFSPDGKWLLTGSDDYAVRVWEIGGTTASSTPVAATTAGPNQESQSLARNVPPAATLTKELASTFAEQTVNAMSTGDIDSFVSLYAERVDYLDEGSVDLKRIRADLEQYFDRWPKTSWQMAGPFSMQPLPQGQCRLTFPISFVAANPATNKQAAGNARETMVLAQDPTGAWKIISRRETIVRSDRSRAPVAGRTVKGERVEDGQQSEKTRQNMEEVARRLQSLFPH